MFITKWSKVTITGYRALGVNSDHVPCAIRYNRKHQENTFPLKLKFFWRGEGTSNHIKKNIIFSTSILI
jgi:hypothetical protein